MHKFAIPLQRAVIVSRPNRFLMNVVLNGETFLAHCPSTGRIGDINFSGVIPCLISESSEAKRKTQFTVEAISLNPINSDDKLEWTGINQSKANSYVKHFLKSGVLSEMIEGGVRSEVTLGKSRLDFKIGNNYLEVKMPLNNMILPDHINKLKPVKRTAATFQRLIKHFNELGGSLSDNTSVDSKAIVLLVFMYDAPPFVPPELTVANADIMNAANNAANLGVETWQLNLRITPDGVAMRQLFKLDKR